MNDEERLEQILALREQKLTPKEIARLLGLRPGEVSALLKLQAERTTMQRQAAGEGDPLLECLAGGSLATVFPTMLNRLLPAKDDLRSGLFTVVVARQAAYNRISVCSYLVDIWCLGVKNALGPRKMNADAYTEFVRVGSENYLDGYSEITLEQAQAIIFSAIEYARTLGFEPHRDFKAAEAHLGHWDGKLRIQCGYQGRPRYVEGPYDNVARILKTLDESVGPGNYGVLLGRS
jgi:hypothetical protein